MQRIILAERTGERLELKQCIRHQEGMRHVERIKAFLLSLNTGTAALQLYKIRGILLPKEPAKKRRNLLAAISILLISMYIAGMIAKLMDPGFAGIGLGVFSSLRAAVCTHQGRIGTLIVLSVLCVLGAYLLYRMRGDENEDERGFHYAKSGEYGTSKLSSRKESEGFLSFTDSPEETDGIIVGRSLDDGKIVSIPADSHYNRNIFVAGSQGTNKSIAFVRNMIIQCVVRGESMIITDPKSELFRDMAYYLKIHGYDVVQWNLVNRWNSNGWDVLHEIDGDEEFEYIDILCSTIIKNSNEGAKTGDKYYEDIDFNLLKALVLYVVKEFPEEKRTLGQVYNMLLTETIVTMDAKIALLDFSHPAKCSYNLLNPKSKEQAWTGLGTRLKIFQSQVIQNITGHREINIDSVSTKKTAVFCIVSDSNTTYNMLNASFISMVFIKLFANADRQPGGRCLIPVHLILEEFPNVGVIDAFRQKEGTARSRGIGIDILVQNWPQLMDRYGENAAYEIIGGCDFRLFYGCNDTVTSEMVSKLTGISTIDVDTERRNFRTIRFTDYTPEFTESSGVGKRALLMEDEVRGLDPDHLLLFVRGQKPVKLQKFKYYEHPEALKLRRIGASEVIPDWRRDRNGYDIRTGEKALSFEQLMEYVKLDEERFVVRDSEEWGEQRTRLVKQMHEVHDRYAGNGHFPNGHPFFDDQGNDLSGQETKKATDDSCGGSDIRDRSEAAEGMNGKSSQEMADLMQNIHYTEGNDAAQDGDDVMLDSSQLFDAMNKKKKG